MKDFQANMAETSSNAINERGKRLQRCHICDNEFDKYELELHFLTSHTDIDEDTVKENNDCNDQPTDEGPDDFESDFISNNSAV